MTPSLPLFVCLFLCLSVCPMHLESRRRALMIIALTLPSWGQLGSQLTTMELKNMPPSVKCTLYQCNVKCKKKSENLHRYHAILFLIVVLMHSSGSGKALGKPHRLESPLILQIKLPCSRKQTIFCAKKSMSMITYPFFFFYLGLDIFEVWFEGLAKNYCFAILCSVLMS